MEVKQIGNLTENAKRDNPNRRRVYDSDGLSPTLQRGMGEGGNLQPLVVTERKLGNIYGFDGGNYAGNVYDDEMLSPTIRTYQGGNQQPMIVENIPCKLDKMENGHPVGTEKFKICDVGTKTASTVTARYFKGLSAHKDNMCIAAMRSGNPDNPPGRTAGSLTEQRLEPNSQGICSAKTSAQKDNTALIKQATKEGCIECEYGGVADLSFPGSKTRRGRVQDKGMVCPTITAESNGLRRIENQYRIRKLTPLECWRIMGFSDEDFRKAEKVNSNSQLYKQAGNSIVKNVLMEIFGKMMT